MNLKNITLRKIFGEKANIYNENFLTYNHFPNGLEFDIIIEDSNQTKEELTRKCFDSFGTFNNTFETLLESNNFRTNFFVKKKKTS